MNPKIDANIKYLNSFFKKIVDIFHLQISFGGRRRRRKKIEYIPHKVSKEICPLQSIYIGGSILSFPYLFFKKFKICRNFSKSRLSTIVLLLNRAHFGNPVGFWHQYQMTPCTLHIRLKFLPKKWNFTKFWLPKKRGKKSKKSLIIYFCQEQQKFREIGTFVSLLAPHCVPVLLGSLEVLA